MVAENVTLTVVIKLLQKMNRHKKKDSKQLKNAQMRYELLVIEGWACEIGEINDVEIPRPQMQSYPHAILDYLEAYGDNNQRKEPTSMLTIENVYIPILVGIEGYA